MVSVGKECMQPLISAQYIKSRLTSGVVMDVIVDGPRCKRGDGTIQEADLAEDIVMDGEMYGSVKSFCFL